MNLVVEFAAKLSCDLVDSTSQKAVVEGFLNALTVRKASLAIIL